jgi:glycosyltransferase involved in cell wall biosynthesis
MRPICHLNLAPGYRGGERQTQLLIRELARRGYEQRLVARRGGELPRYCDDIEGLDIRLVASNPVAAALAVRGSKVAHSHEGRSTYSGLIANWLFGIPYVITRRVVAPQSASFLRSLAYRRGTVVAISRATAGQLQVRHPDIDPVIIPSVPAGFDVDEAKVAEIRNARPGKTLIGHVGALDNSSKGQSTIIEVAHLAADLHPEWHFILCGDGKDRARFREEIGDLSNIEMVGWVDNVGDYLQAFDLFLYPSLHEALGSTLLDAMQFGLPIVAGKVGGIPDFVEDGVNGRLVEPENADQLYAAIDELLSNEDALAEIRSRNIEKAKLNDTTHMADAYETLYREITTQV